MAPRVLASGPKPCGGKNYQQVMDFGESKTTLKTKCVTNIANSKQLGFDAYFDWFTFRNTPLPKITECLVLL